MSIRFSIPNAPTQADYNTSVVSGNSIPIVNKPALKPVATSGAYNDLTGRPALATVATSGKFADLVDEPILATVATSGAYNDLSGKPALATVATSGLYKDLSGNPEAVTGAAAPGTWNTFVTGASTASVGPIGTVGSLSGAGGGRYVQAWYFVAAPLTVAASSIVVALNNTGSLLRSWEYIDPALGFVPGNVTPAGNADQSIPSQHYPGFVDLATPTFAGQITNYDIAANQFKSIGNPAFTLPAGWNELRLYYQSPNEGYLYIQTSLSMSNFYAFPVALAPLGRTISTYSGQFNDIQAKRVVTRNINVTNILTITRPLTALWYTTVDTPISGPGGAFTFPGTWVSQTAMTKLPPGTPALLSGTTLTFPFAGIYTISFGTRYTAGTAENAVWFQSISGTYGANNSVNRLGTNATSSLNVMSTFTGFFAAGDRVTPCQYSATANTMSFTNGGTFLSITLLYAVTP